MAKDNELLIRINGSAKQFNDEIDKVTKKTKSLQDNLSKVAKSSAIGFAALATAVGTTAQRFAAFEKTFSNVQTLLDQSSFSTKTLAEGTEELRRGVIALGAESGESFDILNKGLFDLVSAGVSAEKSIETLRAATELATAGATDTATAVKALSSSITSFGESAGTAEEIAQKFFTAQKFGVTTVGELANEFNKVAGTANALGLSFDETLASLSSLTADGAKPTAEAATQLRAALNSIILVQSKLANESVGVRDALSLQNVRQRGLVESLRLLQEATGGNVVEIQRLLGSSEALAVALSLTGPQAELVAKQTAAIGNEAERAATFQEALTTKQQTLDRSFARLTTSIDAAAVTFGQLFAPAINSAADALTAIAVKFSQLDKGTLEFLATVTKVALAITGLTTVAATLGLGYIKLRAIALALNAQFKITALASKAVNLAFLASKKASAVFAAGMRIATGSIRGLLGATGIGLLLVVLGFLITDFNKTKAVAVGTFNALLSAAKKTASAISEAWGNLGQLLSAVFSFDTDKINESLNNLKESVKTGFSGIGTAAAEAYTQAYNETIEADREVQTEADAERQEQDLANTENRAKQKANVEIAQTKKSLTAREKLNEGFQNFEQALDDQRIQAFEANNNALIGLTNSKNKTLKSIGKRFAAAQAGIDAARGAIAAYQSLAGIPLVGPALGVAAAAAVLAYGAERISDINNAAQGGIVPNATGGSRDRVPMMLEPGELIVPRQLRPTFIEQFGRPGSDSSEGGTVQEVTIGFRDEAFEIIDQQLRKRRALGIGG